jgi:hypothetical protein
LTPEEMHRQLLVRRAQPLGASAYQAADPQAALADMQRKIGNLEAQIAARKATVAKLSRVGPSSKGEIDAASAEIAAFEDEVHALERARARLPSSSRFARIGEGAAAGTGRITYAGIQIETAEGTRIALEFAETTGTEHAEEVMIASIEKKLTPEQLRGARVTVVGDQVVCGERCVPALSRFAERNGIASVDGIVFQRRQLRPPPRSFIGPQELASPRTTLRSMTEPTSAGTELITREVAIYRGPAAPLGASSSAAPAAVSGAEQQALSDIEHAAAEEPGFWSGMADDLAHELRTMTPAKAARFGKNMLVGMVKGYVTARMVDAIIGESRLENDLAALDAANHVPHDDRAERARTYTKDAISLLPLPIAAVIAVNIRLYPLSAEFFYEATLQETRRKYEKFKAEYGDSEEAGLLYQQGLKAEDDWYNGITPWD